MVSALALFGATEFAPGFFPYWFFTLSAMGHGLLLPVIAVLHVRHAPVRQSGALLGTIAGTATAILGVVSATSGGLIVATLFVAGVWWWTIGKLWAETAVFPRPFGWITMALAIVSFALALLAAPAIPLQQTFPALLLSPWLLVLAALLWRSAR